MTEKLLFVEEMQSKEQVFVACSGGVDSMVLVHLLKNLKLPVSVLHCNFQLRGADSYEDERFVQGYCQQSKIPFYSKRFDTLGEKKNKEQSIQEVARKLRYAWFDEIFHDYPNSVICTAHHADDQEEQIWLRLMSSGRLMDLGGVPAQRDQFLRPLLYCSKADLSEYALNHNLTWREDSSNSKADYTRNKIRLQLKPLLNEIDERNSAAIRRLGIEVNQIKSEAHQILYNQFGLKLFEGEFFVSAEFWESQLSIVKEILLENWKKSNAHLAEIERFYRDSKVGSELKLNDGYYVIHEKDGLWLGNENSDMFSQIHVDLSEKYALNSWEHAVQLDFDLLVKNGLLPQKSYDSIEVKRPESSEIIQLSKDKTRKVKKFMNDKKWPHHHRKVVLGYYTNGVLIAVVPLTRLKQIGRLAGKL